MSIQHFPLGSLSADCGIENNRVYCLVQAKIRTFLFYTKCFTQNVKLMVLYYLYRMKISVDICLSPALYPHYQQENDAVVVVDIFRATTTMCAAFNNGAAAIIPVADIASAKRYKAMGFPVGAERNARRQDFADFGNSPFEYTPEKVSGREIVFTTTNGTRAIEVARDCGQLLIGAFSNIDALAEACVESGAERVVVLCAGWNNQVNIEDALFGAALAEALAQKATVEAGSDAVRIASALWESAKAAPIDFLKSSDHYKRLVKNGAESDAPYCFEANTVSLVPFYDKTEKKLRILNPQNQIHQNRIRR